MLLRLASTAFKNVSFSLETGKRGSQVWMRVSLLGTELGWACYPAHDKKEVKLFLLKLLISPEGSETRKEMKFGI